MQTITSHSHLISVYNYDAVQILQSFFFHTVTTAYHKKQWSKHGKEWRRKEGRTNITESTTSYKTPRDFILINVFSSISMIYWVNLVPIKCQNKFHHIKAFNEQLLKRFNILYELKAVSLNLYFAYFYAIIT